MTPLPRRFLAAATVLFALEARAPLHAQLEIGTWVQQSGPGKGMTMKIEACCHGGRRLSYMLAGNTEVMLQLESALDGSEAPVLSKGKPTGETMAIKRVDQYHAVNTLKMDGKQFGTSTATLSPDGKTLTVENDITFAAGGQATGKQKEVWIKK
jgi:hypothetical protein